MALYDADRNDRFQRYWRCSPSAHVTELSEELGNDPTCIDRVLTDLDGLNARQVSDLSHDEAGWRLVDFAERFGLIAT